MLSENGHRSNLSALITGDESRFRLLGLVATLGLPDCWVGAGFVRSAVWDHLHGRVADSTLDDIDVIWFDKASATLAMEVEIETRLKEMEPSADWSAKNQARMHSRNGDAPYRNCEDAVTRWPETATAVALRLNGGVIDIMAPCGLDDLFSMVVRPTPAFVGPKHSIFRERLRQKRWLERWPHLVVAEF